MQHNVSRIERGLSTLSGALLATYGLSRRTPQGITAAVVGGTLLYRGLSGHCPVYASLGMNTAEREAWDEEGNLLRHPAEHLSGRRGVNVEHSVTINRPRAELYRFWRQLDNLPRFMAHLESVETLDHRRSRWVARGPAGVRAQWDAEIINEVPDQVIGWASLPGSQVSTAGSVTFRDAPGGRGTELRVRLQYNPPAGKAGAAVAWLTGEEPSQQIREDLRGLKERLEA
jgi:uncharacterized membrane protein